MIVNQYDWKSICGQLTEKLRLRLLPVGLKYFESREELEAVEKIRMPKQTFAPCMIINQAAQFGWTAACVPEHIHANYCRGIHGMFERDEKWFSGKMFEGAWFDEAAEAKKHHAALACLPCKYAGFAAAPLARGRIQEPDVCILYMNPSQAFLLLCAYQFDGFEKLDFTFSGESTCADSWVSTMLTGKPKISLPCYADRKFADMREEDLLVSMKPEDLCRAVEGLGKLHKNGLRYPMVSNSLTTDMIGGLPASYIGF